jgi:hypothetical protein
MSAFSGEFNDIVAGLDIGTVLPMDGTSLLADKGLGEEFRTDMQQTYALAVQRLGCDPQKPSVQIDARLDRAFSGKLNRGQVAIRAGELIAVSGADLIHAGTEVGDDALMGSRLLGPGLHLFGTVKHVSYGKFLYAEDFSAEPSETNPDHYRVQIKTGKAHGLLLYLAASMICQADGYGQKEQEFGVCTVPLDNQRFTFYKVAQAA